MLALFCVAVGLVALSIKRAAHQHTQSVALRHTEIALKQLSAAATFVQPLAQQTLELVVLLAVAVEHEVVDIFCFATGADCASRSLFHL